MSDRTHHQIAQHAIALSAQLEALGCPEGALYLESDGAVQLCSISWDIRTSPSITVTQYGDALFAIYGPGGKDTDRKGQFRVGEEIPKHLIEAIRGTVSDGGGDGGA